MQYHEIESDMQSRYVHWLQTKTPPTPTFHDGEIWWKAYGEILIPATIKPVFLDPNPKSLKMLLRQSGLKLIRYSSHPIQSPTPWWYIVCDHYDHGSLSSKMRNQIKRGYRNFSVEQVDFAWLAQHGYPCYVAASSRYNNYQPVSEKEFRNFILSMETGHFEHWGIFANQELAGYSHLIKEEDDVGISVLKFNPNYLKNYCAYAFFYVILRYYVAENGCRINNGNRPISHDTNIQDFLLKFGFKRWFGRLNIIYQPWLNSLLRISFPFRRLVDRFPEKSFKHRLKSLFFQEELRRKCLQI